MTLDPGGGSRGLHVVVAHAPTAAQNLRDELRLLKAGVLYSDSVTFYSIKAQWLRVAQLMDGFLNSGSTDVEALLSFCSRVVPGEQRREWEDGLRFFDDLKRRRHKSSGERALVARLRHQIGSQVATFQNAAPGASEVAGREDVRQLAVALDLGWVYLPPSESYDPLRAALDYVTSLVDLARTGDAYPLLDEVSSRFVSSFLKDETPDAAEAVIRKAKRVNLSAELFHQLPLFDEAPMDEIIGIRAALDRPLRRFRTAVKEYAGQVVAAPWTGDFTREARELYVETVDPAIAEIEDEVRAGKMKTLSTVAGSVVKGAAVAVGMAKLADFSDLIVLLSGVAPVLADALAALQEARKVEQNRLYFLYAIKAGL